MAVETKLPGFGLPVNYRPDYKYFPNAMDEITDKPNWDMKIIDNSIVQKWRQEALAMEGMDVSERMLDWVCTNSLQDIALYGKSSR